MTQIQFRMQKVLTSKSEYGTEPGCVESTPRNLVIDQARTCRLEQQDIKNFSDSSTDIIGLV